MKLPWSMAIRSRRWWIVGGAVVVVVGWLMWRPVVLAYRLQDAANDMFDRMTVMDPKWALVARQGGLPFGPDLAELFDGFGVADLDRELRFDLSAKRRSAAVSLLRYWSRRDTEPPAGVLLLLARTAATDSHATVRALAANALRNKRLSDDEANALAAMFATLPLERRLEFADDLMGLAVIPAALQDAMHERATHGDLPDRIRGVSALVNLGAVERAVEIVESQILTQPLATLDENSHRALLVVLKQHAPHRLKDYLKSVSVARLLKAAGDSDPQTPDVQLLARAAAEDALKAMHPDDWGPAARALLAQPGGIAVLTKLLRTRPQSDRAALLAALRKDTGSIPRPVTPNSDDLNAVVDLVCSTDHDVTSFVSAYVLPRHYQTGFVGLAWTETQRERLRLRVAAAPSSGAGWKCAVDVIMSGEPTPADLAAFERFLDETIAVTAPDKEDGLYLGVDRHFDVYWRAAGPERAGPHLVNAFRRGEGRNELAWIVPILETQPLLLDSIGDEAIRRAVQDIKRSDPKRQGTVYARAAYFYLQRRPQKLTDETWEYLWLGWLQAFQVPRWSEYVPSGGVGDSPARLPDPKLSDVRKLVPPAIAERGALAHLREVLTWRPSPDPVMYRLPASVPQDLTTLAEFDEQFAAYIRTLSKHENPNVRLRVVEMLIETPQNRPFVEETLLKMSHDADRGVIAAALDAFDRLPKGPPAPAAYSARIRELADPQTPAALRSIGIYRLVSLPDRNDADRELVDASADEPDDRIRAAVRYAIRNWNNPAKK